MNITYFKYLDTIHDYMPEKLAEEDMPLIKLCYESAVTPNNVIKIIMNERSKVKSFKELN